MKCHNWEDIEHSSLDQIGRDINSVIKYPSVVILTGVVGAGKTTFVRSLLNEDMITSPTYSVINDFGSIVHADLYRIKNSEEIIHLELDLYSEGKEVIFIEWGMPFLEDIKYYLETSDFNYYELEIEILKNKNRSFFLKAI